MKLTRRIKRRATPSVIRGFTVISRRYWPVGYYRNRGIDTPLHWEIGRIESIRFIVSPGAQ